MTVPAPPPWLSRWFAPREFTAFEDRIVTRTGPGADLAGRHARLVVLDHAGDEHPLGGVHREVDASARLVMTTGGPGDTADGAVSMVPPRRSA